MGWSETQLQRNVMLAFFLPGIVYLADAVGTQTETIAVRGLSVGVGMRRMAPRELLAGVAIGLALPIVAGPLVWWLWGDGSLAGADPAFGSGPLATLLQDLLSIVIYFGIVTVLVS